MRLPHPARGARRPGALLPRHVPEHDRRPRVAGRSPAAPRSTAVASSIMRYPGSAGTLQRVLPDRRARTLAIILESVARAPGPRPRRVLDVGSGSGMVPLAVSRAGDVEVLGIDPFGPGDRRLGPHAELQTKTLEQVDGAFDLVMLHHSLEHMPDPLDALQQVRRLLTPDGTALVRVPTASSLAWREYGTDWIRSTRRCSCVGPVAARTPRLARRADLAVVGTYDDSGPFQFWGSEQARRGIHHGPAVVLRRRQARRARSVGAVAIHPPQPRAQPSVRRRPDGGLPPRAN